MKIIRKEYNKIITTTTIVEYKDGKLYVVIDYINSDTDRVLATEIKNEFGIEVPDDVYSEIQLFLLGSQG